jgi:hypothetical protein
MPNLGLRFNQKSLIHLRENEQKETKPSFLILLKSEIQVDY